MRLIDANKLFNEICDNGEISRNEKFVALKAISEQPTALSVTDLMLMIGELDVIAGKNNEPYVSFKDVLRIVNGGYKQ